MREALKGALAGLAAGGPLREGAAALFGAPGYRSERTAEAGSVDAFLERFGADRLSAKWRALFDSWRAVEIVFQITGEEIADRQPGLAGFDAGRHKSFLFLAVELEGAHTRVRLAETARAADPHRAHLDILADLALPRLAETQGVRDFDALHAAWERALDVEALNRRFYGELFAWFERAVAECRFPDDGAGTGNAERHVIRLITRLLFVWFLKEKGLVPAAPFEERFARAALRNHAPESTDYYRAVLQNLFFATLNTEVGKRAFGAERPRTHRDFAGYRYRALLADPESFVETLTSVPFVNGGLFDCLDDLAGAGEGGRRIDAFTDDAEQGRGLSVPARLFFDEHGLFPLFRRYKFTVEENTPLDREVALDPELLGRTFENLLAAYNPETRANARKATGSYYTPRHIVDYMVGEALAAALAAKVRPADGDDSFWRARLGYLLDWEDACDDAATLFDAGEIASLVRLRRLPHGRAAPADAGAAPARRRRTGRVTGMTASRLRRAPLPRATRFASSRSAGGTKPCRASTSPARRDPAGGHRAGCDAGQSHLKTGCARCEPIPRKIGRNARSFGVFAVMFELCSDLDAQDSRKISKCDCLGLRWKSPLTMARHMLSSVQR